jgi:hypothetical protein
MHESDVHHKHCTSVYKFMYALGRRHGAFQNNTTFFARNAISQYVLDVSSNNQEDVTIEQVRAEKAAETRPQEVASCVAACLYKGWHYCCSSGCASGHSQRLQKRSQVPLRLQIACSTLSFSQDTYEELIAGFAYLVYSSHTNARSSTQRTAFNMLQALSFA